MAYYGPDDSRASKVVVGIVQTEGSEPEPMQKWHSESGDVRNDDSIMEAISSFLRMQAVKSVVAVDRIIGCPHEEGVDYPQGGKCPACPFWANRDRFSGKVLQRAMDFWHFWRSGDGFDKAAWFEEYKRERNLRPIKPGKARRNAISNARRVIEWVIEEASPVRCLETNIYSVPTEHAADLSRKQRATAPFDFLLIKINPRVIVVHGVDATGHIRSKNLRARVLAVSHFSRGWSQAKARSLGQQIRREI